MDVDGYVEVEGEEENPEVLENQNPAFLVSTFMTGKLFLEEYGWFLLIGIIILLLLFNRLQPYLAKWLQKREDQVYYSKYEGPKFQDTFEEMQKAREKMQKENDQKTEIYVQQQKEREERKRQQRLEKLEGKSCSLGFNSTASSSTTNESGTKPKPKSKSSLSSDYLPMAGSGGGASYRPSRRNFSGG